MPFPTLLVIAVALAMDALAVSLAAGICLRRARAAQTLRMAAAFGFFQALMPILGWLLGLSFRSCIESFDHWVAFGLLALVGGRMILGGVKGRSASGQRPPRDPTRGLQLITLSVATSIDALAVGLSLAVLDEPIWLPALVIGAVCFAITAAGVLVGGMIGRVSVIGRYAEILGGLILVGIGIGILHEHQALPFLS